MLESESEGESERARERTKERVEERESERERAHAQEAAGLEGKERNNIHSTKARGRSSMRLPHEAEGSLEVAHRTHGVEKRLVCW